MSNVAGIMKSRPKVERVGTGIAADARAEIAASLQAILDASVRLMLKTQLHHWNVVGPLFHSVHVLTEAQYTDLFRAIDTIAERIRALGHPTAAPKLGTEAAEVAAMNAGELVADLIADHEAICRLMRVAAAVAEEAEDIVTNDMLVDRLAFHEKAIWMLRAIATA